MLIFILFWFRFASFVGTGNHFTDQELLEYNSEDVEEYSDTEYTTDVDLH